MEAFIRLSLLIYLCFLNTTYKLSHDFTIITFHYCTFTNLKSSISALKTMLVKKSPIKKYHLKLRQLHSAHFNGVGALLWLTGKMQRATQQSGDL